MSSSSQPLVSIVTPSYNSMPYIQAAVRSVRAQTYSNIEHIVIDGGSTDGTKDFLKNQSDLVWKSEPDRGQSHALNKGFQLARGEIIGWLNSDDTYQCNAVSIVIDFLKSNPEIDLVYSDLCIIDELDRYIGITKSQNFQLVELLRNNFIKQTTVFMRRHVIDILIGVDENLHYTMDRELWLRAGIAGFKMQYLENFTLANFRLIPGTKSYEQASQFHKEWVGVLQKVVLLPIFNNLPLTEKQKIVEKEKAQYHWAQAINAIELKNHKGIIREFRQACNLDPTILLNRGTWMYILSGIFGIRIDRLRKFKKNAKIYKDSQNGSF